MLSCARSQASEVEFIKHLVNVSTCYGHRADPRRLRILMLTAYFDESGIHEGNHLCIVAGYVGNDAQWEGFISEWIPALGRRKNLHMKKIRNFKRAARLLDKLGPIPERHHLQRIVGGIRWRDYNEIVKGPLLGRTNPYMHAAGICIASALAYIPRSEEIAIVFSAQDLYQSQMEAVDRVLFRGLKRDSRLKSVTFSSPESTVCFDPADYLAFEVREFNKSSDSEKARAGISILGNGKAVGGIYTPERLREIVDFFGSQGLNVENPSRQKMIEALAQRSPLAYPTGHAPRSLFINLLEIDPISPCMLCLTTQKRIWFGDVKAACYDRNWEHVCQKKCLSATMSAQSA